MRALAEEERQRLEYLTRPVLPRRDHERTRLRPQSGRHADVRRSDRTVERHGYRESYSGNAMRTSDRAGDFYHYEARQDNDRGERRRDLSPSRHRDRDRDEGDRSRRHHQY